MSKKIQVVAAVALALSPVASAQQAVQWNAGDGGNGHWYQYVTQRMTWPQAQSACIARSGHLVSLLSAAENAFVNSIVASRYLAGGFQSASACEPACDWRWSSGESWAYENWNPGEPNDLGGEDYLLVNPGFPGWNDITTESIEHVIEWSADCNGDGIVDYGQCRDGSLPDYNGNNIPDCCESGVSCVLGNYPVQWRTGDGGNEHWYQLVFDGHPSWTQARSRAEQRGGHLATLTSQAENDLGGKLSQGFSAMLLGGFQDRSSPEYAEPLGGWRWVTGEPWIYTNWGAGEPNDASNGHGDPGEGYLSSWTGSRGFKWGDRDNICPECIPGPFLVEWSADCNNDGIVDYGQILLGQLADANQDGVPDVCQNPSCHDADLYANGIVNGADLAILLSEWGPVNPTTTSDLNHDGVVSGADLSYLLSFWGPCP